MLWRQAALTDRAKQAEAAAAQAQAMSDVVKLQLEQAEAAVARLTKRLQEADAAADTQATPGSGQQAAAHDDAGASADSSGVVTGVGKWQATTVAQLEQEVADLTSRLAAAEAEVEALRSAATTYASTSASSVCGPG